jgi:hypothetical protein
VVFPNPESLGCNVAEQGAGPRRHHRQLVGRLNQKCAPACNPQDNGSAEVTYAGAPEDSDNWASYARLAPHVLAAAPLGDHSSAGWRLVLDTIRYLQAHGDTHGSGAVGEQLLDRWRSVLGPDHPDTLTATSRLTLALVGLVRAEPACVLGEDTLQRCCRVLGPDHLITLGSATGLTLALAGLGGAEPARALGEDTLQRCRRVLSPDHNTTLWTAANLTVQRALMGALSARWSAPWARTPCSAVAGSSARTTRSPVPDADRRHRRRPVGADARSGSC